MTRRLIPGLLGIVAGVALYVFARALHAVWYGRLPFATFAVGCFVAAGLVLAVLIATADVEPGQ